MSDEQPKTMTEIMLMEDQVKEHRLRVRLDTMHVLEEFARYTYAELLSLGHEEAAQEFLGLLSGFEWVHPMDARAKASE